MSETQKTAKQVKHTIIEHHIDIDETMIEQNLSVLDLLTAQTSLSKQRIKDAMAKGAVWLSPSAESQNAKPLRRKSAKLKAGNQLSLYYNEQVLAQQVNEPQLIADEGDYSVWNKPYGVWSQGSKWGDHCSIGRLVEQYYDFGRQCFVVHRLDRAASGLMLIAHNKKAAMALSSMFAKRQLIKIYRAKVTGNLQAQDLSVTSEVDEKPAKSVVNTLNYDALTDQTLVQIQIETGRKHQIRKHLSDLGFPIIGDRLYGNADEFAPNLQLCAFELEFICPIQQQKKQYQLSDTAF